MNYKIIIIISILFTSFIFSQCENEYWAYGSENCDTAWNEYDLNCQTLQSNYGWDCSGCMCPGDEGGDGLCWESNPLDS